VFAGPGVCCPCLAGYYCVNDAMNPCLAGCYCPNTGNGDDCPFGCVTGDYCPEGSEFQRDCHVGNPGAGWYCPNPAQKLLVQEGYWTYGTRATSQTQCSNGGYCPVVSTSDNYLPCPQGHVCYLGLKTPCDDGEDNPEGYNDFSCELCAMGYFCVSSVRTQCSPGTFCPPGSRYETPCSCSLHGDCPYSTTNCTCWEHYSGDMCEIFECYNISSNEENVCGGNGYCKEFDDCGCDSGFSGLQCEIHSCFGISVDVDEQETLCSGHGTCWSYNECDCSDGYISVDCSILPVNQLLVYSIIGGSAGASILVLLLLVICIVVPICIYVGKQKKSLEGYKKYDSELEIIKVEEEDRQMDSKECTNY